MFVSYLVFLCYSIHPRHLIHLQSLILSFFVTLYIHVISFTSSLLSCLSLLLYTSTSSHSPPVSFLVFLCYSIHPRHLIHLQSLILSFFVTLYIHVISFTSSLLSCLSLLLYTSTSSHSPPVSYLVFLCYSIHSVYSRIWKLPVIFFRQLPMYVRCAAMRGAPQCAARTSLIGTTLAKLSKQLRNITYRQLFNKHTILSCLFLKIVVYCNKQPCK